MSDQDRAFTGWENADNPLLDRVPSLWRGRAGEVTGIIETIDRHVESAPAGIGRVVQSAFRAEGAALFFDLLFYGVLLISLYVCEVLWLRGSARAPDGRPLTLFELVGWSDFIGMSVVNIAVFIMLHRFALFRALSRLAHRGGRVLRDLLFFFLFIRSSRAGDTITHTLTLLDPHSGNTYGVRMRGRIEGAPLITGHRITCRGTHRHGVLYAREGIDHEYSGGARFVCRARGR